MNKRLLRNGAILFLLGLLTGVFSGLLRNPRAGLSAHLEGLLNGMFLLIVGAVWAHVALPAKWLRVTTWLLTYGTFANWAASLLGAVWGTSKLTPIAGHGFAGSAVQEAIVSGALITLTLAMIAGVALLAWGLRGSLHATGSTPLGVRPDVARAR